ncbi:hypothetical protein [Brucella intermedia]|uniref:hypothetical protein n=1 Tax=Brucella intermedia TaxID=94625 RepID=UPI00236135FA|nr:hypothetical protein [Brucella intermedia]
MVKETDIFSHCDVNSLPISDDLKEAIEAWDDEYQSTFDSGYPPDSGFISPDLEAAHKRQGAKLAERLQEELGDYYSVEYKP